MTTFIAGQSLNQTLLNHVPWIRPGAVASFEPHPRHITEVTFDHPFADDVRLEGRFTVQGGEIVGGRVHSASLVTPDGQLHAKIVFDAPVDFAEAVAQLQATNGVAALLAGDDLIKGSNGGDRLHGLDGNDTIVGGHADDVIQGGQGADVLHGRGGADRFEYLDASESSVDAADLILAFHRQEGDVIDLSQMDADAATAGDQAFAYVGEAFTGMAGELTIVRQPGAFRVEADIDGDAVADLRILVMAGGSLNTADFLL